MSPTCPLTIPASALERHAPIASPSVWHHTHDSPALSLDSPHADSALTADHAALRQFISGIPFFMAFSAGFRYMVMGQVRPNFPLAAIASSLERHAPATTPSSMEHHIQGEESVALDPLQVPSAFSPFQAAWKQLKSGGFVPTAIGISSTFPRRVEALALATWMNKNELTVFIFLDEVISVLLLFISCFVLCGYCRIHCCCIDLLLLVRSIGYWSFACMRLKFANAID
mmetsp:Transcript_34279/g.63037  ORF Transcript_34279/g.63037 Transcript_34279/m.63037 type:complete len:228 (+) Transcript_34279:157-840(+)